MQRPSPLPALATSIKIPGELRERLQNLAASRQRTPHALMIQAIESFVSREEKREAWRQEGMAAWEEYRQTGLHLTNAEAKKWLAQLAEGNSVEPPKCHI
ncbi:CopG family transcriptional regulator [Desulfovibrio sp. OttesenSCG-928-I05]|nr:CopG family transcriptional regulator [Desulfovibrio sp. OttesenSCG-928-I05]